MSIRNKSLLVTGGAGFIGSHLVDRLVEEGAEKIVIIDNFFTGNMENLKEAAESDSVVIYNEDASSYMSIENIISREGGIDVVFNLATKPLPWILSSGCELLAMKETFSSIFLP